MKGERLKDELKDKLFTQDDGNMEVDARLWYTQHIVQNLF